MARTRKSGRLFAASLAAVLAGAPAYAQTLYKHVDANGRVTYSSEPMPGAKPMSLEPLTILDPLKGERAAAARNEARAEALSRELAAEREKLAAARHSLALEKQKPEVLRASQGDAQAADRYEEKIRTLTEQVESQKRRVEALERELTAAAVVAGERAP